VLFAITTSIHIFQLVRKRTWYFIPFIIGGICKSIPCLQCLFPIQTFAKLYLFWIKQLGYHSISIIYFWPKKSWLITFSPIVEVIGYIGRILNSGQTYGNWTIGPYIAQSLTILLAPAFFAASIYMVLSRLINLVDGAAHSPVPVRWLTPIFVTGDVISFLAQSGGKLSISYS
jgi:hypothetical protein